MNTKREESNWYRFVKYTSIASVVGGLATQSIGNTNDNMVMSKIGRDASNVGAAVICGLYFGENKYKTIKPENKSE